MTVLVSVLATKTPRAARYSGRAVKNCQSAKEQSFVTQCRIFYRHRSKNTARKSGNIADFCEHWGDRYQFMIVLDADSLVEGETIVTMVDRISSDQRIGILQVPPVPVGRSSMFARIQHWLRHFFPLSNVPAEPADNCGKSSNQRGAKNRLHSISFNFFCSIGLRT